MPSVTRLSLVLAVAVIVVVAAPSSAVAQDPPPPIGPFVIDARGTVPLFTKEQQLADSRGLVLAEIPGAGLGVDAGAHVYLFKWKAVTFGLGAQLTLGRSHASPGEDTGLRPVTTRFVAFTPQLSLNFGTGHGWSFLSGGIGSARLSIVPDDGVETPADQTALRTVNYGGGARWFIKPRFAFSLDVRFHELVAGTPDAGRPGSPPMTFVVIGAGVSMKPF